ncbi:MAG: hypothetical protein HYX48_01935 [Chlamydiales bacterium]|nr:hypothetical protein [Chlamydiales bacterium]
MDLKTAKLLFIFSTIFIASFTRRSVPKDLIFLIGGAFTLLLGITPAKEFMYTLTSGAQLTAVFLFALAYTLKEPLFDRTIRIRRVKDLPPLLHDSFWSYALSGVLFAAALQQTLLPAQVGNILSWMIGTSPFLLVAFLLGAIYLVALILPPVFVLLTSFPFAVAALQRAMPRADVTIAAVAISLLAVIFSSLNVRSRERVKVKVRAPLLIAVVLVCAFLIPQFWLVFK